jgi:6-phosphogluconolactonase
MKLGRKINFILLVLMMSSLLTSLGASQAEAAGKEYLLYAGTYTGHGSKGIYGYRFNSATGKLTEIGLAAESEQPSFLTVTPNGNFLYAIHEVAEYKGNPTGAASAYAVDTGSGKLKELNEVSTRDQGPAYITLDHSAKYAIVANYTLGSVAILPILKDGHLGEATAFVQHKGSSVNPERQKGPHVHSAIFSPDNRFVIVADLGLDELVIYPFNSTNGTLGTPHAVKTQPGAGPRHMVFGPRGQVLYLITEMQSTVIAYSFDAVNGTLRELQTISTLPADFRGKNTAAEIAISPSGRFIYASNRGNNNIVIFARDEKTGALKVAGSVPTDGKTPRNFVIDPTGDWLLVANKDSDNLVVFRIGQKDGHLTQNGEIKRLSSPVCLLFVPQK